MKLSELSYREYIALEVFGRFAGSMTDSDAAWRAFGAADAFLKQAGKEDNRLVAAELRAKRAEAQTQLLLDMQPTDEFASQVALLQLWEMLGVDNQTAAADKLRELLQ